MKYVQLTIVFFLLNSCITGGLECGDLLKKYATKPNKVEFLECRTGTGQTILEADYLVKAKDSEEIEKILIREYGMGKLKFVCCGWEPSQGKKGYLENERIKKLHKEYVLEISMFANAERKNENGITEIEFNRNNVDFILTVKIVQI